MPWEWQRWAGLVEDRGGGVQCTATLGVLVLDRLVVGPAVQTPPRRLRIGHYGVLPAIQAVPA